MKLWALIVTFTSTHPSLKVYLKPIKGHLKPIKGDHWYCTLSLSALLVTIKQEDNSSILAVVHLYTKLVTN